MFVCFVNIVYQNNSIDTVVHSKLLSYITFSQYSGEVTTLYLRVSDIISDLETVSH